MGPGHRFFNFMDRKAVLGHHAAMKKLTALFLALALLGCDRSHSQIYVRSGLTAQQLRYVNGVAQEYGQLNFTIHTLLTDVYANPNPTTAARHMVWVEIPIWRLKNGQKVPGKTRIQVFHLLAPEVHAIFTEIFHGPVIIIAALPSVNEELQKSSVMSPDGTSSIFLRRLWK